MAKKIMIVESPAKAKTIKKYLGSDFEVKSSYGHIRDLKKNELSVDIEHGFKPHYEILPEKRKVVNELKSAVKEADEVWLATDEDREGEAISWHLCEVLGLDIERTPRIVFHEITKSAIQKAVQQPRSIDMKLVDAQQARRVLDRLVGYKLSETLWRKIRGKLSAGRVQSVALRLIVEREREIQQFQPKHYYKVEALFEVEKGDGQKALLKAVLDRRLDDRQGAMELLQKAKNALFHIKKIEKKPLTKKPPPPFITSTLQQEASRKLGFSVTRTMRVAQSLYESGWITYMRTDSVHLSDTALQAIKDVVVDEFGEEYLQMRQYQTKSKMAQEAHEAIRPTYLDRKIAGNTQDEQRLYELIWKRTIASQMADAQLEKTTVEITMSTEPEAVFRAEAEVLRFDGFLRLYQAASEEEEESEKTVLPPLEVNQQLPLREMTALERQTKPPARYSEASLVKKLEELGIGRPSTYAPTIAKLMDKNRSYVVKESREGTPVQFEKLVLRDGEIEETTITEKVGSVRNRLFATDIGMIVVDFLKEHFEEIVNYGFTAEVEEKFDEIARGKIKWQEVIETFYGPFQKTLERTLKEAGRIKAERVLGKDPNTGLTVVAKLTRVGPAVQLGTFEELGEGQKPRFANLKPDQSLETITLEEALQLLSLPKYLGEFQGKDVVVNRGRYGPYIQWGKDTYISLPKGEDPYQVDRDRALELIGEYLRLQQPIASYRDKPIYVMKGRYGPYLKWDNKNIKLPKDISIDQLTAEVAVGVVDDYVQSTEPLGEYEGKPIERGIGRYGPYIKWNNRFYSLPKGRKLSELTLEEAIELIQRKGQKSHK